MLCAEPWAACLTPLATQGGVQLPGHDGQSKELTPRRRGDTARPPICATTLKLEANMLSCRATTREMVRIGTHNPGSTLPMFVNVLGSTVAVHTSMCGLLAEAVLLNTAGTRVLLGTKELSKNSRLTLEGLAPFTTCRSQANQSTACSEDGRRGNVTHSNLGKQRCRAGRAVVGAKRAEAFGREHSGVAEGKPCAVLIEHRLAAILCDFKPEFGGVPAKRQTSFMLIERVDGAETSCCAGQVVPGRGNVTRYERRHVRGRAREVVPHRVGPCLLSVGPGPDEVDNPRRVLWLLPKLHRWLVSIDYKPHQHGKLHTLTEVDAVIVPFRLRVRRR
jgi:hypothetical protein